MAQIALLIVFISSGSQSLAQSRGGGGSGGSGSSFGQTYEKRKAERFDIITYLTEQKKIRSAQDAKWGNASKDLWFTFDWVFEYGQGNLTVRRNGSDLGKADMQFGRARIFLNNFITSASKTRSISVDLGVEGFITQSSNFSVASAVTQGEWKLQESGAGLMLRPFGRSSQDTGLVFRGGLLQLTEKGMFANTTSESKASAAYVGADAKVYLLPFLGGKADYMQTFEASSDDLAGKWEMRRFRYGGFMEFWLIQAEVFVVKSEYSLRSNATAVETKEVVDGYGVSGSLFF